MAPDHVAGQPRRKEVGATATEKASQIGLKTFCIFLVGISAAAPLRFLGPPNSCRAGDANYFLRVSNGKLPCKEVDGLTIARQLGL